MLNSSFHRVFAPDTGGGLSGATFPSPLHYFNPGNVLTIAEGTDVRELDLDRSSQPLARQFDVLLSPKDTRLSRDPNFLERLKPYEDVLKTSLVALRDGNFRTIYIDPLLQELTVLDTEVKLMINATTSGEFDHIADAVGHAANRIELLDKELLLALVKWSGDNAADIERALEDRYVDCGIERTHGSERSGVQSTDIDESSIDNLIAQLQNGNGAGSFQVFDEGESLQHSAPLSDMERDVRRAFSSIVNHRLGNLPPIAAELMTYFAPGAFGADLNPERVRMPNLLAVKILHLQYLALFVEHGNKAQFYQIVEWAQLRLKPLPQ